MLVKPTGLAEIRPLRVFILLLFFLVKLNIFIAKLGQISNKVNETMQDVLLNFV